MKDLSKVSSTHAGWSTTAHNPGLGDLIPFPVLHRHLNSHARAHTREREEEEEEKKEEEEESGSCPDFPTKMDYNLEL